MLALILAASLSVAPTFPFDEAVSMRVHQANQLKWDAPTVPVQQWVFSCGKQIKTVIAGHLTSITFGELVTEAGVYTRCGIVAQQDGQVSTPYPIPNFEYHYSYWPMTKLSVELIGLLAAVHAIGFVLRRHIARCCLTALQRFARPAETVALAPPMETLDVADYTVLDARRRP